ncbi:MAG TPA: CPBP family intramembrane glutamic endopeptidase [Alphaproteobacteria bacterium]|nr:CPBP family intramembrane glutamic endopeptidase [Alphaproteobacteria bacterium]
MTPGTPTLPTLLGLVLALGGPAVLASRAHPRPDSLGAPLADQFRLLALTVGVIAMVVWERRPAASIGWHGLSGLSLAWGAGLAFVFIRLLVPLERLALHRLDLGDVSPRLSGLAHLPLGFLAFAGLVAGVAEETLFRGYAFTRIAELSGSEVLAGLVTVAVFALAQLRLGWGAVAAFAVNGAVLTAFFAWRRDLLANITAHALTDVVALLDAAVRARRSRPD